MNKTGKNVRGIKTDLAELKGIVFICQTLSRGGAENFNTQLLSWFHEHQVPIKAWTTLSDLNEKLDSRGIEVHKISLIVDIIGDWKGLIKGFLLFPLATIYYSWLTYQNRNFGTILLSGYIEKILVTPWAKLFNVPVVWIEFGPLETVFSKFLGLPKFLYHLVSKLPDCVIEPSKNTWRHNKDISKIPYDKVYIIPCGIGPLAERSSKPKKLTAYYISRMEPGKGQDLLIRSWPGVLKKYPQAKLYLIGEGDFRPYLEKLTSDLKINNSVEFLGWVEDLPSTVSPYTLAVLPTVWALEGLSLVFMEAMSIGKPIVCFKWGSNLELVNSTCAILVPKGNVKELSNAIIRIFSDDKLAHKLGSKAKKRFNELFVIDQIAPRYGQILLHAQKMCQKY